MNVNLFTFFKQQQATWKRENARRSEDYLLGGTVALRAASDALTARKDQVSIDQLNTKLAESEKENRYCQERNKQLNQQVRDITGKYEQLQREHEVQRLALLSARSAPTAVARALAPVVVAPTPNRNKQQAELLAENGSLRHRILVLEGLLVAEGKSTSDPDSELNGLRGKVNALQLRLDEYEGKGRVGTHVFKPRHFLKRLQDMLTWEHLPEPIRLQFVARHAYSALSVLDGREPEEWTDKPDISQYLKENQHV